MEIYFLMILVKLLVLKMPLHHLRREFSSQDQEGIAVASISSNIGILLIFSQSTLSLRVIHIVYFIL